MGVVDIDAIVGRTYQKNAKREVQDEHTDQRMGSGWQSLTGEERGQVGLVQPSAQA